MLLGNEAFADALDPTVGIDGIPNEELPDQFAFKGVRDIDDLLDEEIALYIGRALPGTPTDWLNENGRGQDKPWVLFVSYPSPHPPFRVPGDIYRRHAETEVTLPGHFGPEERTGHPAIEHLRRIMGTGAITDDDAMRRITAGYLGLVSHLDDQVGQ
ncbi:MAG: hypothetical protein HC814_04700 [Rhodobacteraceae bacterium]|nr:hypothetical protein [Paracoccaceae bacterium]